jgi:hypothetical protein
MAHDARRRRAGCKPPDLTYLNNPRSVDVRRTSHVGYAGSDADAEPPRAGAFQRIERVGLHESIPGHNRMPEPAMRGCAPNMSAASFNTPSSIDGSRVADRRSARWRPCGISNPPPRVGQELRRRHNAVPQDHCEAAFMVNVIGDTHAITLFLMDLTSHVDMATAATELEHESRKRPRLGSPVVIARRATPLTWLPNRQSASLRLLLIEYLRAWTTRSSLCCYWASSASESWSCGVADHETARRIWAR